MVWALVWSGTCLSFLIALASLYRQIGGLNQIFPLHIFLVYLRADFGHLGFPFLLLASITVLFFYSRVATMHMYVSHFCMDLLFLFTSINEG